MVASLSQGGVVVGYTVAGVVGLLSCGVHKKSSGLSRWLTKVRIPIHLFISIAVGTYKGIHKRISWSYVLTVSKCRDILVNKTGTCHGGMEN